MFIQVLYVLCLNKAQISGKRLQDHWSSGLKYVTTALKMILVFNMADSKSRVFLGNSEFVQEYARKRIQHEFEKGKNLSLRSLFASLVIAL